jgi:hypothetical protein
MWFSEEDHSSMFVSGHSKSTGGLIPAQDRHSGDETRFLQF